MKTLVITIALLLAVGTSGFLDQAAARELKQRARTNIYMIASRDAPCGSRTVPVPITVQGPRVLTHSLLVLLDTPDPHHPDYFTALEPHDLTLQSVAIDRRGTATIRLRGSIDVANQCDSARARAQLEQTALQFPSVKRVTIHLNGQPFESAIK